MKSIFFIILLLVVFGTTLKSQTYTFNHYTTEIGEVYGEKESNSFDVQMTIKLDLDAKEIFITEDGVTNSYPITEVILDKKCRKVLRFCKAKLILKKNKAILTMTYLAGGKYVRVENTYKNL